MTTLEARDVLARLTEVGTGSATAVEAALLLRRGAVSPVELAREHLRHITEYDPGLNSFVTVDHDPVDTGAIGSTTAERRPCWGIPVSVKDLTCTAGLRTTYSSKAFADHVPLWDDPVAKAIRAAGMVILGKTNTPEFGMLPVTESELNGVCRNPWDPLRTAGGSSGGAAASVAAGFTPVAHGSDGAGSLRIPAACCGVFAVMPGPGRIPPTQRVTFGAAAQDGVISRTVADALLFLHGLGAITEDEFAVTCADDRVAFSGITVAVTWTPPLDVGVDQECLRAARTTASLLSNLGCQVEERTPDWVDETILDDLMLVRSSISIAYGDPDPGLLDQTTARALKIASAAPVVDLHRALMRIREYARRATSVFQSYDVLLSPTLARLPVEHGSIIAPDNPRTVFRRSAEFTPFAAIANLGGLCALSMPFHPEGSSLPVGVQLAAKPVGLAQILRLAAEIERETGWPDRRPPMFAG